MLVNLLSPAPWERPRLKSATRTPAGQPNEQKVPATTIKMKATTKDLMNKKDKAKATTTAAADDEDDSYTYGEASERDV